MTERAMTEQQQANYSGPRAMSEKGSPLWCWQTITALETQWNALNFDLDLYMTTWAEAEGHRVWEKIPYDTPYGSKEEMLRRLEIGDVPDARARVAEKAMDARPLGDPGTNQHNGGRYLDNVLHRGKGSDYLVRRIARDAPEVWERMKRGEFTSVAAAAREAGIKLAVPKKTVTLSDNLDRVADRLMGHYTPEQVKRIRERLAEKGA